MSTSNSVNDDDYIPEVRRPISHDEEYTIIFSNITGEVSKTIKTRYSQGADIQIYRNIFEVDKVGEELFPDCGVIRYSSNDLSETTENKCVFKLILSAVTLEDQEDHPIKHDIDVTNMTIDQIKNLFTRKSTLHITVLQDTNYSEKNIQGLLIVNMYSGKQLQLSQYIPNYPVNYIDTIQYMREHPGCLFGPGDVEFEHAFNDVFVRNGYPNTDSERWRVFQQFVNYIYRFENYLIPAFITLENEVFDDFGVVRSAVLEERFGNIMSIEDMCVMQRTNWISTFREKFSNYYMHYFPAFNQQQNRFGKKKRKGKYLTKERFIRIYRKIRNCSYDKAYKKYKKAMKKISA